MSVYDFILAFTSYLVSFLISYFVFITKMKLVAVLRKVEIKIRIMKQEDDQMLSNFFVLYDFCAFHSKF